MKRVIIAAVCLMALVLPKGVAAASPSWNLTGSYTIHFLCTAGGCVGATFDHSMTITTSNDATGVVAGTGYIVGSPSLDWTVTGTVDGSNVTLDIEWTVSSGLDTYNPLKLTGTIDSSGGMAGTASDAAERTFTWETTAGAATLITAPTVDVSTCEQITFNVTENSTQGWYAVATGTVGDPWKWGPLGNGTDGNTKQIGPGTYSVAFYLGDPAEGGVLVTTLTDVVVTACATPPTPLVHTTCGGTVTFTNALAGWTLAVDSKTVGTFGSSGSIGPLTESIGTHAYSILSEAGAPVASGTFAITACYVPPPTYPSPPPNPGSSVVPSPSPSVTPSPSPEASPSPSETPGAVTPPEATATPNSGNVGGATGMTPPPTSAIGAYSTGSDNPLVPLSLALLGVAIIGLTFIRRPKSR